MTSLAFWEEQDDLTWSQVLALFISTAIFFFLAGLPFAGGGITVDLKSIIVVFEIVVAAVLVFTAGRLGPIERWAPNLVRLLIIHLVLAMILLASNNLLPWAELMPSNEYTSAVSTLVATLILVVYSIRRSPEGKRLMLSGGFYGSMVIVALTTGLIIYHAVIPS